MAKMNRVGSARNTVSLDALLGLLIMLVPVMMFFLEANSNPFIDSVTTFVVLFMSIFLLLIMWINRRIRIPILEIFIAVYVLFWHLRFLTLALFPSGELVLTRTVVVDHDIFNSYVLVVFVSLIAAVGGILIAHAISQPKSKKFIEMKRMGSENLRRSVKKNVRGIFVYF